MDEPLDCIGRAAPVGPLPYLVGDRVVSLVDVRPGLPAGSKGTVVCGRPASDSTPEGTILVSWDDWQDGHDSQGYCECGAGVPEGSTGGWWAAASEIAPTVTLVFETGIVDDAPIGSPDSFLPIPGWALSSGNRDTGFIDVALLCFDFGGLQSVQSAVLTLQVDQVWDHAGVDPTIEMFVGPDDGQPQFEDFWIGGETVRDSHTYAGPRVREIDVTDAVNEALALSDFVAFRFQNARDPHELPRDLSEGIHFRSGPVLDINLPRPGRITVRKETSFVDGTLFDFTGDLGEFSLLNGESLSAQGLAPGNDYTITEQPETNWILADTECTGGTWYADGQSVTVTDLAPGADVTCTFHNDPSEPGEIFEDGFEDGSWGAWSEVVP